MATMGLSTGSLKRVRSLIQQWEATHGRKATPDVTRALMEAELANASKGANEAVRLEQQADRDQLEKDKFAANQEAQKDANRAAEIQGGIGIAATAKSFGADKGISALGSKLFGSGTAAGGTVGTGASSVAPGVVATPGTGAPALGGATGAAAEGGLTASGTTAAAGETGGAVAAGETGGTVAAGETGTAGGFSTVGAGIAAAVLLDAKIARDANGGEFASLKDRNRTNITGLEFGGVSPGAAALFQKHGVLSPDQVIEKHTGFDIGAPVEDISDFASDIVESIIPGGSDFMSSLGF